MTPTSPTSDLARAKLQAALEAIAGELTVEDVELEHDPAPWAEGLPWFWSWICGHDCASSRAASPEEAIKAACRTLQAMLAPDAAEEALDEIARLCGCPEWHYPGQVVRDVQRLCKPGRPPCHERGVADGEARERARHRGGDGSTTPPGAPYGKGVLCNRALCTAIEDRCGLLVGHPGPCEVRR